MNRITFDPIQSSFQIQSAVFSVVMITYETDEVDCSDRLSLSMNNKMASFSESRQGIGGGFLT